MKGNNSKTNTVVYKDDLLTTRMIDYTGVKFNNNWIGIKPVGRNYAKRILWEFECLYCGVHTIRSASNIDMCTCDCQSKSRDKFNVSFYDWCIENNHEDWVDLWDCELNQYSIHKIGYSSDCKYWFKCNNCNSKHHSESYRLSNLTQGCQNGILCKQCNSLAQAGIDIIGNNFLDIYWDYDLNTIDPWKVSKASGKNAWFKCRCGKHNSYEMMINNAIKREFPCPECTNELKFSKLHTKVINYLENLGFSILQEFNCNIIATNPKTGHLLPYDIEVVDLRLIIEVMGEQHYNKNALFNKMMASRMNVSIEEQLDNRQWVDLHKKQYVLNNGYYYLDIPYALEKRDEFKNVILKKINEIQT